MTVSSERDAVYVELQGFSLSLDRSGRVTTLGRSGRLALSLDREPTGTGWFEAFLPETDRQAARATFQRWVDGERPQTLELLRLRRRDGSLLPALMSWKRAGEAIEGVVLELPPVSELDYQKAPRLQELNDIRTALDVSSIIAFTDRAGVITFANQKFCEISKYAAHELIGKTHRIINSGAHPPEFFQDLWRTIAAGKVWQGDIENRAKDGSHYWVATTIVPFVGADGRPYQYLAIRNDITDRKRMEGELLAANRRIREEQLQLVQAEKMSSIGLLASGVAHEINNPLAGVMACVKALRDEDVEAVRREEYFAAVLDGLERIQQTVRGLLDYSRQRSPQPTLVDLEGVISAALLLISPAVRKKDITVETVSSDALPVHCDRSQLMQALVNVLLNALYAAPVHGHVKVALLDQGARRGIAVIDDGPGIKPELISRVCDPFFTTKPEGEGTGLGLAVTLSLMRANGGDLGIEAAPTGGAKVTLWLPRPAEELSHG